MIIQNTQYTDYSLCFSVLPSLNLTQLLEVISKKEKTLEVSVNLRIDYDVINILLNGNNYLFVPPFILV